MQSDGQKSYLHAYLIQVKTKQGKISLLISKLLVHLHRLNIIVVIAAFLAEKSHIGLSHAPFIIAELVAGIELHVLLHQIIYFQN